MRELVSCAEVWLAQCLCESNESLPYRKLVESAKAEEQRIRIGTFQSESIDGEDLNMSFPGDPAGKHTDRLAHAIRVNVLDNPIDVVIDIHGGGSWCQNCFVYRYAGGEDLAAAIGGGLALLIENDPHDRGLGPDGDPPQSGHQPSTRAGPGTSGCRRAATNADNSTVPAQAR